MDESVLSDPLALLDDHHSIPSSRLSEFGLENDDDNIVPVVRFRHIAWHRCFANKTPREADYYLWQLEKVFQYCATCSSMKQCLIEWIAMSGGFGSPAPLLIPGALPRSAKLAWAICFHRMHSIGIFKFFHNLEVTFGSHYTIPDIREAVRNEFTGKGLYADPYLVSSWALKTYAHYPIPKKQKQHDPVAAAEILHLIRYGSKIIRNLRKLPESQYLREQAITLLAGPL